MVNTLQNLAKRNVAFSGRAGIGDVPDLYAEQAAMERARQAEMGGTPGLASGTGGSVPVAPAVGGGSGGSIGGAADVGLPGAGFSSPEIERAYTRFFRRPGGEGETRGSFADRGQLNVDPADPFGVSFGNTLSDITAVAGLLGIPGMGMANAFVELMLRDAQMKQDQFMENLALGMTPVDPTSGATITRADTGGFDTGDTFGGYQGDSVLGSPIGDDQFGGGGDAGGTIEGGYGGGAGGFGGGDTTAGDQFGGGNDGPSGDAGSGAGGGSGGGGSGGVGCFAKGTRVLMGDNKEMPIEEIRLGDRVMGFNEGGVPEPCEVIGCFAHLSKPVWRLNGSTLVTPGHRFYAMRDDKGYGFWPLDEIPLGSKIMLADGSSRRVDTVEHAGEQRDVFNITVQGLHTYIADGYRVHNIKHQGGYISEDRVPGQQRGDVPETLQEGEYVITADVVDMLGPEFFDVINNLAKMAGKL